MKKLIKNYTTNIPSEKTVAEIQSILAANGARGIATEYDEKGKVKDIFFRVFLDKKELPFRLPARPDRVYVALHKDATSGAENRYHALWTAEAERIAWRICKTWLEAQITLINLEQAKLEEVFLPYLIVGDNVTLFEKMEKDQFLLPSGK